MKITQESDYAIRIILYLTDFPIEERVESVVISAQARIPLRFTLKIMRKLANAGILKSFRGNNGGYSLRKKDSEINLLDVIELIDGPLSISKCIGEKANCNLNNIESCVVHEELFNIQKRIMGDLKSITFEMLANKQKLKNKI